MGSGIRAADDFNAVLKLKPDNFHALYNLGLNFHEND